LANDFLEMIVHVGRRDVLAIARFIHKLEQFLAGQLFAMRRSLTPSDALAGKRKRTSFPSTATCRF